MLNCCCFINWSTLYSIFLTSKAQFLFIKLYHIAQMFYTNAMNMVILMQNLRFIAMYGSDDINFLKLKAYVGSCVFEKLKDLLAGCQLGLDTRQSFISSFCFIWFIKILVCTLLATVAKQTNDCVYTTTFNNNNLNIFKERQHHYFFILSTF